MEIFRGGLVQLLMLTCILHLGMAQHWSYGWLPGGKRSVGDAEASLKMDSDDLVNIFEVASPLEAEQLTTYQLVSEDSSDFARKRKWMPLKRTN
uniref:Progonadoliberin n=1 Tax=Paramormyrops kingsleyae TaxID=1676925 RepID=A0A3B3RRH5_9TELE